MGRRGYVQKRHAEHDQSVCLSDYAQATSVAYLEEKGIRSEERRVGKECRSRWSPYH